MSGTRICELEFGDLVVNPDFPGAVLLFWGYVPSTDPDEPMPNLIMTILRKRAEWEPTMYHNGKSMVWGPGFHWERVESWPS
jgi:hypothetical protein